MDTEQRIKQLEMEVQDLRYILSRKTGLGSADIKGGSVGSSAVAANSITNTKMADDAIKQAELDYEQVNVTVSAGNSSGTAGVTSGSIIIGWRAIIIQAQVIAAVAERNSSFIIIVFPTT